MPSHLSTPAATEYAPFYAKYVGLVPPGDVVELLAQQIHETVAMLRAVPPERAGYRYADGKWSIREVVGHLADTERIMAYRALRVARADPTPLPGFDENAYVAAGSFEQRPLESVVSEWEASRAATIALFQSLNPDEAVRVGTANGAQITPRALAFIIAGHERHHRGLLVDRYGLAPLRTSLRY